MVRHLHILMLSALVTLVALGGTVVAAQGFGHGGPRGRGPGFGSGGPQAGLALRALDLTDAQREEVRQLMQQHRQQTRALVERVRNAQEARRQAVEAIPVDDVRIGAAMQELADAETQLAIQQAHLRRQIYELLTEEQRERLQKLRAEREARMKQRRERMQQRLEQRPPRPQA